MTNLNRRYFCASSLVLLAAANSPPKRDLRNDVARYIGLGEHRAGTTVERKTARWLEKRLAALGYQTRQEAFPIRTISEPSGILTVGKMQIAAFPQWYPPEGVFGRQIEARLVRTGDSGSTGAILVVPEPVPNMGNWNKSLDVLVEQAHQSGASAIIMAVNSTSGDLFVCNQHSEHALPLPVALIAKHDLAACVEAAVRGETGRLRLSGQSIETKALNIVASKSGQGKMIVISTPLTGWFRCGGERGPGIALWLRMAAFLAQTTRPVLLLGNGSHEIGHLGMDHALKNYVPSLDDVAIWLHFGASIAATRLDAQYGIKSPQVVIGTAATEGLARQHLLPLMTSYATGNAAAPGEAGQVLGAGYERFVGMIGTFPAFHTQQDNGDAIDFDHLERVAKGAEALLTAAAGEQGLG
jgi:hypothetical protein